MNVDSYFLFKTSPLSNDADVDIIKPEVLQLINIHERIRIEKDISNAVKRIKVKNMKLKKIII